MCVLRSRLICILVYLWHTHVLQRHLVAFKRLFFVIASRTAHIKYLECVHITYYCHQKKNAHLLTSKSCSVISFTLQGLEACADGGLTMFWSGVIDREIKVKLSEFFPLVAVKRCRILLLLLQIIIISKPCIFVFGRKMSVAHQTVCDYGCIWL